MSDTISQARQLMAEALDCPVEGIGQDASITQLEGWNSLAFMRLVVALEEKLGHELEPEKLLALNTVADIASLLSRGN